MTTLAGMTRAYYMPYMSIQDTSYNHQDAKQEHYRMESNIAPNGKSITVSVSAANKITIFNNLHLTPYMRGLLPICVKDTLSQQLIEKVTQHGAPSRCSVENNEVSTFDKVVYDYTLNDCEHVIFKD